MPEIKEMWVHAELTDAEVYRLLRRRLACFGGNRKLKIYGTLHCVSGKRMKREHRVFFRSAATAEAMGYRPCGNCLRETYKNWKHGSV